MPKDNENLPFTDDATPAPSEPQGFAHDQMVRCDVCLRANPPVRANCLYCAAALPGGKKVSEPRAITLKPVDETVSGYNCILVSASTRSIAADKLQAPAQLLKLSTSELQRIVDSRVTLPLARTETREEAELITRKLMDLGLGSTVVSDVELGFAASIIQIRAVKITDTGITLKQIGGDAGIEVPWSEMALIVSGRLISKRVESSEQKGKGGEQEITEAREFFADEPVMDLYMTTRPECFRITANNFDFSSLPNRGFVAAENFATLLNLIRTRAPAARHDDSYLSLRQTLDAAWPSGQRTGSGGWRRERPGKYSIEAVTETNNVNQFTRYSRLRSFLLKRPKLENEI
ncbi:MAG TPA: hypothetical protein VFH15_01190 [Pyrinomonadaceae bacterium]|nr:hypothetical protein [Pyrinomonadaceae bacterium]